MIGLVLEGGGTKGAYQVGAYYAMKKCHIKIDAVVGASIGSINAAFIAAGQEDKLLELWKEAKVGEVLGFSKEYVEALNGNSSLIDKITYAGKDLSKMLKNKGIPLDGLRKLIKENITEEMIRKSKMEFGLNTVRLNDLKPLYLFKNDIPEGKMYDYIISSCYLPVFKMEKIADQKYYLDGGFYDKSPSNMLEEKGYTKIYIIALNGIGVTHKKLNKANIITIKPSRNLGKTLSINKKEINNNIKLGFYDTIKKLKNLDGYKYIFKKNCNLFYNLLIKKVNNNDLKRIQAFFHSNNSKVLIIKSIEYILNREHKEYECIYKPYKEIKRIRKIKENFIVYKFIKQLRFL